MDFLLKSRVGNVFAPRVDSRANSISSASLALVLVDEDVMLQEANKATRS